MNEKANRKTDVFESDSPLVLGIESTCDETAAAVVKGTQLLSNVVASSMDEHAIYGGVIPEIASRAHAQALVPVVSKALAEANVDLSDLDAIAVSAGPGLAGCLVAGVSGAKALAWAANKPLYGVNHVIGHFAVTQLQFGQFPENTLALIVSGGHTSLLQVRDIARDISAVGSTLDDAAGECFDKIARLLGFPYPGGPFIDRYAKLGNPAAFKVPKGLTQGRTAAAHPYDFSFSSLADSVAQVLSEKTIRAAKNLDAKTVVVGGGFSANSQLRQALSQAGEKNGINVRIPEVKLCTDNGAMIAVLGASLAKSGIKPSPIDFRTDSSMSLEQIVM